MKPFRPPKHQHGILLIEGLIGLLIFLIGILAMLALQTTAIAVQADAQYRIEAASLSERMLANINLRVDRSNSAALATSLAAYAHNPITSANCNFTGAASTNGTVLAWVNQITASGSPTRLPGSTTAMQQILVNTGNFNQVTITICWQGPNDKAPRRETLVSYVN